MTSEPVICDTGVLSRHLLEVPQFVEMVGQRVGVSNIYGTLVIRIELFNWISGFRQLTKPQRAALLKQIREYPVFQISEPISELAMQLSDKHINSKPSDTLIAATALFHDLPLYTLNKKDFAPLGVRLYE